MLQGLPFTDDARWLMTTGALAFVRMHDRGMPVDVDYCKSAIIKVRKDMSEIEEAAWTEDGGREWSSSYGRGANLSDNNQARHILYEVLGLTSTEGSKTATGLDAIGKDALEGINHPIVRRILEYRKRDKAVATLKGILRETVDGRIHPFFHVCGFEEGHNTVRTYRTSSSEPNFQNMPIRDPEIGRIIRMAFRAPPGWCIVEADYSKMEVHAMTWYHKDPTMIEYLINDHDMHKDLALECFMLTEGQYAACLPKPKAIRNEAKSNFIFAEFYGSYWPQVAYALWGSAAQYGFRLGDGTPFLKHFDSMGITKLGMPKRIKGKLQDPEPGTFCDHIKNVEFNFWKKRFPKYDQWRRRWYEDYQKKGSFDTLAGFHHEGVFRRNEVINTPGQGTGSHCKMRGVIGITKTVAARKMRAYPNAEIHDSILGMVPEEEVPEYIELCKVHMAQKVMEAWPWIITPITIEVEVSPPGGTWYEKREWSN